MFELQHFTQFILTKEKARCSISSNNNDLESEIISTSAPNRKAKSSLQPTVLRENGGSVVVILNLYYSQGE
ncbi:hypothetical protein WN944_017720 [Citrus x changshan-huyou]|uniref:Uncharacterized protein n=1 Tax=Citrus x changshan-huyou TaxID=2935761 RepID=A0AAP0MBS3_9ROSI